MDKYELETTIKELEVSRVQKQHEADMISSALDLLRCVSYENKRKGNMEISIRQDVRTSWSIYVNDILQIAPLDSFEECVQYLAKNSKKICR